MKLAYQSCNETYFDIEEEINLSLESKLDGTYWIRTYQQRELDRLTEPQLIQIANCYRDVFNESWGEDWSTETALAEVRDSLQGHHRGREPIAVLLYKDGHVSGFTWGLMTDIAHLIAKRDMPYDLPRKKKTRGHGYYSLLARDGNRQKKSISLA